MNACMNRFATHYAGASTASSCAYFEELIVDTAVLIMVVSISLLRISLHNAL